MSRQRAPRQQQEGDWDRVAADWLARQPFRLWREFTDRQQLSLIERWLGPAAPSSGHHPRSRVSNRLLKTDLFDEVAGRGLVPTLLTSGLEVSGIDISPVVVAEAASRNATLHAVVADVRSLPFPDGTFDAVFSGSTLDHFDGSEDILASLVELRRVIRPGGLLLLTMDNPANPVIWLRNGLLLSVLRRTRIVPYQVGATLPPRPLAAAVTASGFDIIESTAVMHCPRAVAVAAAGLADRLPRACRSAFMDALMKFECLESLPTRWLTGHYIAVHAIAREAEPR